MVYGFSGLSSAAGSSRRSSAVEDAVCSSSDGTFGRSGEWQTGQTAGASFLTMISSLRLTFIDVRRIVFIDSPRAFGRLRKIGISARQEKFVRKKGENRSQKVKSLVILNSSLREKGEKSEKSAKLRINQGLYG
ncbi:MAG: hypothetical protein JSS81_24920 [Acidobacteria bacterium]|nr:hypothetical protein [Acidobacteriota bacterium]